MKEISAKVQEVRGNLYNQFQRSPTVEEIAEATGFTTEQIIEAIEGSKAYGTYSLDKTFDDMGEDGESSFLEKYTGFDEMGYERVEMAEIIKKVMSGFNDQYRYIFKQRFIHNKSQAEIAKSLGVSQMTVSRAEKNIIGKFRDELHKSG